MPRAASRTWSGTSRRCALAAGLLFSCITPLVAASPQPTDQDNWSSPNFFHTIALPVPTTPYDAKWRQAWAGGFGPYATTATRGDAEPAVLARLATVQRNADHRVSHRADPLGLGAGESSSTGRNTLARESADCEDYAIAKIKPLLALGFRPQDLYLVIGDDGILMARRAVLVVRAQGKFWVLDSLSSTVVDAELFRDFDPVITLSADRKWVHGYVRGAGARSTTAPRHRPLIAPGPGLAAVLAAQDVTVPLARTDRCEARVPARLAQLNMPGSK